MTTTTTTLNSSSGVNVRVDGKLGIIQMNKPKRKNALTPPMYAEITKFLAEVANNPNISMVAITGTGDYYSSGNDFGVIINGKTSPGDDSEEAGPEKGLKMVRDFVDILIDFPKPIVAVLNGPAIGIAVTTLALMDAVYSTDQAWLQTPFTQLGLCPEGCSSLTFPRIMGPIKSSELLFFGQRITATEAHQLGLITKVYAANDIEKQLWPKLKEYSELPPIALKNAKQLCRGIERELLHKVNAEECKTMAALTRSEETMEAMFKWFNRRSKL